MNESVSTSGDTRAGTQLVCTGSATTTGVKASPVRGSPGRGPVRTPPRGQLLGEGVELDGRWWTMIYKRAPRGLSSAFCFLPQTNKQTKNINVECLLGKTTCPESRETAQRAVSAVAWGTDGRPLGGPACKCAGLEVWVQSSPTSVPSAARPPDGPHPPPSPPTPPLAAHLAGSSVSRGPGARRGEPQEREAQLCQSRQIFTSKAFPPLGRLGALNIDFSNGRFWSSAPFGLECVEAEVGEGSRRVGLSHGSLPCRVPPPGPGLPPLGWGPRWLPVPPHPPPHPPPRLRVSKDVRLSRACVPGRCQAPALGQTPLRHCLLDFWEPGEFEDRCCFCPN